MAGRVGERALVLCFGTSHIGLFLLLEIVCIGALESDLRLDELAILVGNLGIARRGLLSPFERSALTSYFRLATNRSPAYEHADAGSEAHFLIVDADHAGVVEGVVAAGRVRDSVFIGSQAPDGAVAWMTRPIDPLHVLRELDAMVDARAGAQPAPDSWEHGPRTVSRQLEKLRRGAIRNPSSVVRRLLDIAQLTELLADTPDLSNSTPSD